MDTKFYGEIIKAKDGSRVPDDEWVCFLAKDNAFAAILPLYLAKCIELCCDDRQIDGVLQLVQRVQAWRREHPEKLRRPDIGEHEKTLSTLELTR